MPNRYAVLAMLAAPFVWLAGVAVYALWLDRKRTYY